ncbi:endo alpha-1,4 polygalactosaminidase [Bacillus sp. 2205SS5-2]|uniref:endo alpha-1,4 polygalactosaminidase n=1 Tax=Bacillus sp. 2205SS5-2 TaxID=3109031 RepID=UPI003006B828
MGRMLVILSILILVGVVVFQFFNQEEKLSYKIFYDQPTETIMEEMNKYDVLIVEPNFYQAKSVKALQKSGTKVYGYLSIMEAGTWNETMMRKWREEDYFRQQGEKVYFEKWQSYLMNITSKHYRNLLLEELNDQIIEKGFDGVFFDTVGDIDDYFKEDADIYEQQVFGLLELLEEVKDRYPNILMIQNWGINLFMEYTHPYMDAIMWEDFQDYELNEDDWGIIQVHKLKKLKNLHPFDVFTVSFVDEKKSREFAEKHGFIHYHEQNNFNTW